MIKRCLLISSFANIKKCKTKRFHRFYFKLDQRLGNTIHLKQHVIFKSVHMGLNGKIGIFIYQAKKFTSIIFVTVLNTTYDLLQIRIKLRTDIIQYVSKQVNEPN